MRCCWWLTVCALAAGLQDVRGFEATNGMGAVSQLLERLAPQSEVQAEIARTPCEECRRQAVAVAGDGGCNRSSGRTRRCG